MKTFKEEISIINKERRSNYESKFNNIHNYGKMIFNFYSLWTRTYCNDFDFNYDEKIKETNTFKLFLEDMNFECANKYFSKNTVKLYILNNYFLKNK